MDFITMSAYGDAEALRQLGERMRDERLRRNFTQQHVAQLAGISLPTFRKLEQGDGTVEIGHFARVLAILGHADRLAELIPLAVPPVDRRALALAPRQRASTSRQP
jgi:transcriptional regulator with XRE-family HTH domain